MTTGNNNFVIYIARHRKTTVEDVVASSVGGAAAADYSDQNKCPAVDSFPKRDIPRMKMFSFEKLMCV